MNEWLDKPATLRSKILMEAGLILLLVVVAPWLMLPMFWLLDHSMGVYFDWVWSVTH